MSAYRIKLEPYTIRFREQNVHDTYYDLNALPNGVTFKQLLSDFFHKLCQEEINDEENNTFIKGVAMNFVVGSDFAAGSVDKGNYGIGKPIVDMITGEVPHVQTPTQADCKLFHFLSLIPATETFGLLIFQKYGVEGFKSLFSNHFYHFVRAYGFGGTEVICEISPHFSPEHARKYFTDGQIKTIRFRKYAQPSDTFEQYGVGTYRNEDLMVELVLKAKRGSFLDLNRLERHLNDPSLRMLDIPEFGMDSDEVETIAEINVNGHVKSVNIESFGHFKPEFDVDDDVQREANNQLGFGTFRQYALPFARDLYQDARPRL